MPYINSFVFAAAATGPTPEFVAVGAYDGNSSISAVTPGYPAGLAADDILLLHVHLIDGLGNASISSVSGGWTLVDSEPHTAPDDTAALYWKRATGSESGTETVTVSETVNSGVLQAVISAWRGCVASGTPYEAETHTSQTSTTSHIGSGITTLGPNRRVVTFFGCSQTNTTGTNTNGWTEDYEFGTAAGVDACSNCNSIEKTSAGAVAGCSRTMLASVNNISFTLALLPT